MNQPILDLRDDELNEIKEAKIITVIDQTFASSHLACRLLGESAPSLSHWYGNNNELYLHNTSTYSIAKAMSETQGNYVTLIIICHKHQNKLKYIGINGSNPVQA